MKKKCVIVLGMHRSGTSAFTGFLSENGFSLGKNLLGSHESNKKGHFENLTIVLFNEMLLKTIGSEWYDAKLLNEETINKFYLNEKYKEKAKSIIKKEFTDIDNLIAIKDPRMCLLFPFWKKILIELDFELFIVLPYRDPLEIAFSLEKRDNIDKNYAISLWLKYIFYAEKFSRQENRLFFDYANFIENPLKIFNDLLEKFNIEKNLFDKLKNNFIDKGLKNNNSDIRSFFKLPEYVYSISSLLKELSINERLNLLKELDENYEEFEKNNKFFLNNSNNEFIIKDYLRLKKEKSFGRKFKLFIRKLKGKK